jgi:peptidoglycan LD-endopeptidase LytH
MIESEVGGILTERGIGWRPALRARRLACVMLVFVSFSTLAACDWRGPAGTPAAADAIGEALVGSEPAANAVSSTASHERADAGATPHAPVAADMSITLDVPVSGVIRSQLRDTYDERRGEDRTHEALDILAPRGTPVLSATDGRLLKLFDSKPGGLMVYAADASGRFILLYGHLDGYADGLREGMPVVRGQLLGYVGTTGNAAADTPHLHFGILRGQPDVSWWEGEAVNPYPLLMSASLPR